MFYKFLDLSHFQMVKQKACLLLENSDELENLNVCFAFDLIF